MKCISSEYVETREDGKQVTRAFILADEFPEEMPTSGADVDGMHDYEVFAPMSILFIINGAIVIANENGIFEEWGE